MKNKDNARDAAAHEAAEMQKKIYPAGRKTLLLAGVLVLLACAVFFVAGKLSGKSGATPEQMAAKEAVIQGLVQKRAQAAAPELPAYARDIAPLSEQGSFRGDAQVVVGKDGVLFEATDIDELFGFTPQYAEVTDEYLQACTDRLAYIQQELKRRGIASLLVFSPSKAAEYSEYLPDWYLSQHAMPEGYERACDRILPLLKQAGVTYLSESEILAQRGLTNSFAMTAGQHNSIAGVVMAQEMIAAYQAQTGEKTRQIDIVSIAQQEHPRDLTGDVADQDLFRALYANHPAEAEAAVIDSDYYTPVVKEAATDNPQIPKMWIHGGDAVLTMAEYLGKSAFSEKVLSSRATDLSAIESWEALFEEVSYIVLEVDEAFVYRMGGAPGDAGAQPPGKATEGTSTDMAAGEFNVHASLYEYLKNGTDCEPKSKAVVLGEDGQLFTEEGIRELYGLSERYTGVTEEYLSERAERFAAIQAELQKREIAFTVLFTPSKAALYKEDVPARYAALSPDGYERPYTRFAKLLDAQGVAYIDSASLLTQRRVKHIFAPTSDQWSGYASAEIVNALMKEYTAQTGQETRLLDMPSIRKSKEPVPFEIYGNVFNFEADLRAEYEKNGRTYDDSALWYYTPLVETAELQNEKIGKVQLQGRAFMSGIIYWAAINPPSGSELVDSQQFDGNKTVVTDWEALLEESCYIVIEINEADVYRMDEEFDEFGNPAVGFQFVQGLHEALTHKK